MFDYHMHSKVSFDGHDSGLDLAKAALAGDFSTAADLQIRLQPLIELLFCEVNPIPVKTAANLMGLPGGEWRLPLCEMTDANLEKLKKTLARHGLIVG